MVSISLSLVAHDRGGINNTGRCSSLEINTVNENLG